VLNCSWDRSRRCAEARIATWQSEVDQWKAKHDALQADRDELQARFDWLLMRWIGREPRQQDVQMMSALQEELSRQMHLTAHAVQAAREYKEALRTNDNAYTHLFGLGALLPNDKLRTYAEIEAQHAAKGVSGAQRPQSARAVLGAPAPPPRQAQLGTVMRAGDADEIPAKPKASLPASLPIALRVSGPGGDADETPLRPPSAGPAGAALRPSAVIVAAPSDTPSLSALRRQQNTRGTRPRSGLVRTALPTPPPGARPSSARVHAHRPHVDPSGHALTATEALALAAETTAASQTSVAAYSFAGGGGGKASSLTGSSVVLAGAAPTALTRPQCF
jgi:hypothetical protein